MLKLFNLSSYSAPCIYRHKNSRGANERGLKRIWPLEAFLFIWSGFLSSMNSALWSSHNSFCIFGWSIFVGVVSLLSMWREDKSFRKYDRCKIVSHSLQVIQIVHEIPCASIVRYHCLPITFSLHICISDFCMVCDSCTWLLVYP
jgi:hypothetical protein